MLSVPPPANEYERDRREAKVAKLVDTFTRYNISPEDALSMLTPATPEGTKLLGDLCRALGINTPGRITRLEVARRLASARKGHNE